MSINNSSKEESEEERRERERQEYNAYVLRDGIWEKIQAQIDKKYQMIMFDKIYERTRKRIREKGGMIKHDDAMRWVILTQSREIQQEILDEAIDELGKSNSLLAENLKSKDQKIREDAERALHIMMEAAENPN